MGEKIRPGTGAIYIDGVKYEGAIVDYTIDSDEINEKVGEYVRQNIGIDINSPLTLSVSLPRITLLKLTGLWEMVLLNCPSRRVKHLMEHGSERTRYKNYQHACRLLSKMVRRVE